MGKKDAVGKAAEELRCHFEPQPRLPAAADAGHRHETVALEVLHDGDQILLASDEGRTARRQVVPDAERVQRREVAGELGMTDLEDALGPRDITQAVEAE